VCVCVYVCVCVCVCMMWREEGLIHSGSQIKATGQIRRVGRGGRQGGEVAVRRQCGGEVRRCVYLARVLLLRDRSLMTWLQVYSVYCIVYSV
jgi:hypothetical protein